MREVLGYPWLAYLGLILASVSVTTSESQKIRNDEITIALGGDVMLGRLINQTMYHQGPGYIWGDLISILEGADFTFVNLECVIARSLEPFIPERVFYFRADPVHARTLSLAGVDGVSLANNHALDFRGDGLLETMDHLDRLGIVHAGAAENRSKASAPAVVEIKGIRIAIVAFADHFREYGATEQSPGINLIDVSLDAETLGRLERVIGRARGEADLVIFSIHWGPNMRQEPTREFIHFARAVMDLGADIFHGHSAHVFQGIEVYGGKVILYDSGDLIDDYAVDPVLRNDRQILFRLSVSSAGLKGLELIPIVIQNMQVNRATGDDFEAIRRRIEFLSRPFGTRIVPKGDRLWIPLQE
ncbi:MAG: CapA family protein [Fidelibacterota bacterium]